MSNKLLQGKTYLVTGASSGIGKQVAITFANFGAKVVAVGRNVERLKAVLNEMTGNDHVTFTSNLEDLSSIQELMNNIYSEVGMLDGLVHCAGIQKTLPLKALKESHFDDIFDINVKSAQFLSKEFKKNGRYNTDGSSIIFMSSVAAFCGEPGISTYSASKAALQGLAKALSLELARDKVRVNCIAPGHVETEMSKEFSKQLTAEQYEIIKKKHPLGLGTAQDVANSAVYLASDLARWVTGTTLIVDGGYSAH